MTNDNLHQARQLLDRALSELRQYKYAEAIQSLRSAAAKLADDTLSGRLDDIESRYFYMLRYISSYAPASSGDIADIAAKIKDIAAIIRRNIIACDNTAYGAQIRFERLRPEENIQSIISDYLSEAARLRTDPSALTDPRSHATLERLSADIFNRLWAHYRLDDDTYTLLEDIIADTSISEVDRELWINALGLSLFYYRDSNVIRLLQKALANGERRMAIASAVWLVIIATVFSGRMDDPVEKSIWESLTIAGIDLYEVYSQIIRSLGNGSKDFFNDLASLSQRFRGLDLNNAEALKNIDLSTDDYDKIRRFNEAQASGADVFGRSIGNMRYFPFFASLPNWFIPFDPQHSLLADITDGEGAEIAESIAMMPHIADSDKYALLLAMSNMPSAMRSTTLSTLVDGMRSMSDTPEFREAMSEIRNIPDSTLISNQIFQISRFIAKYPKVGEMPISRYWNADTLFEPSRLDRSGIGTDAYIGLSKALGDQGNLSASCRLLRHIVAADGTSALADAELEMLADMETASQQPDSSDIAEDCYAEILRREPGRLDIAVKLSRIYLQSGKAQRAADILIGSGVEGSGEPAPLICLAQCYEALHDLEQAIETLHQADFVAPDDDFTAKLKLAELYLRNGQPHESAGTIDLIPADIRRILPTGLHGIALWLCGNTAEAKNMWLDEISTPGKGDSLDYIKDLRHTIAELGDWPVAADKAYPGLRVAPDILLYRLNGSKFGNI